MRAQVKKRGATERPPLKIFCEHASLQERVEQLRVFRKQHAKLKEVILKVRGSWTDARSSLEN